MLLKGAVKDCSDEFLSAVKISEDFTEGKRKKSKSKHNTW